MTEQKLDEVPSLLELYELYNKEFICVTYNLTKKKTEYLNYREYPNLSVLDAIENEF